VASPGGVRDLSIFPVRQTGNLLVRLAPLAVEDLRSSTEQSFTIRARRQFVSEPGDQVMDVARD